MTEGFDPSIIDIAQPGVCDRCGLRGMLLSVPVRSAELPTIYPADAEPIATDLTVERWCIGCAESRNRGGRSS